MVVDWIITLMDRIRLGTGTFRGDVPPAKMLPFPVRIFPQGNWKFPESMDATFGKYCAENGDIWEILRGKHALFTFPTHHGPAFRSHNLNMHTVPVCSIERLRCVPYVGAWG